MALHKRRHGPYDVIMPRMWRVVAIVGCVGGLIAPSQALAVVLVPPGKGGANQYFETIPTSHGEAAPPGASTYGSGSVPGGGGGSTSSRSNLSSLGRGGAGAAGVSRLGTQGKAAVVLAAATAPKPAPPGAQRGAAELGGSGSGESGILDALDGSGGLGILLPGLLVIALLGAFTVLLARLRGRGRPPQAGA